MWKVIAFLIVVFVLGELVVRYVRKNPLDPEMSGTQVAVESQEFDVRFQRNGRFSGTYFVSGAKSMDWTREPVNARLEVIERDAARAYLESYPDFHLYGSDSSTRLAATAAPLALVAANRMAYGDLQALLARHEARSRDGGEHLCIAVAGESLTLATAESLEDGHDGAASLTAASSDGPTVYADELRFGDCAELLASPVR
ncbi:MAG TPA: hypothetical protein VMR86_21055 [Myxococcota bacterium]|nr:hypothetical protein [Myxococcota bacterium]